MSLDQPGSSFGDSNAQPPTPRRTPISAVLPSPVFETPKNDQGRFDESSGWTPRFAEEYSVFNATPGNLRGSQTPFPDFGPPTPYSQQRPLSTERIGHNPSVHASALSPNPSLHLPPVEPSKILRSSPNTLHTPTFDRFTPSSQESVSSETRSAKKIRRGTIVSEPQGQTATPPPSAHKGARKLAPKLDTATTMQDDQDFGQQAHFMAAAHQQHGMGSFVSAQGDLFSYPLSAPATAPAYAAQRSFWDPDPSLAGMEIDFSASNAGVFQPPTPHQGAGPVDWTRTDQILQSQGGLASVGDGHAPAGDTQSSLVPQPPLSMLVTSSADHTMFAASYPTPIDDPFRISDNGVAVNPELLFSRPQSVSMDGISFSNQSIPGPAPGRSQVSQGEARAPPVLKPAARTELRRSASAKDVTPRKQDRASASSPIKEAGRPGLSRSFSENRGKKTLSRPSLPPLAPRPRSQLVSNAGVNANKPIISQPQRPSGRSSPPKSHHHHRLSSLSSIPESTGPQMRTQATFKIDANGRARVETSVVLVDDELPPSVRKRHSAYAAVPPRPQQIYHWNASGGEEEHEREEDYDDSSSTDDEPIIIPSRNTSFALPDPVKPTGTFFHSSQRSISERSTTSSSSYAASFYQPQQHQQQGASPEELAGGGGDSDGETVVDGNNNNNHHNNNNSELTPTRKGPSGDALSELRKLRETRQKKQASGSSSSAKPKRYVSSSGNHHHHHHHQHQHHPPRHPAATSPTTLSDSSSLPTPTTASRTRGIGGGGGVAGGGVRCVCNRPEAGRNELLVQCESCEMYVHGRCVNISQRTLPSIYICAFCAETPNMRGRSSNSNGKVGGGGGGGGGGGSTTSPLAHKSLKSFR